MDKKPLQYNFIKFIQPAGDFYFFKTKAEELLEIAKPIQRKYNYTGEVNEGIERRLDPKRVFAIKQYILNDSEALFPTSVIIALSKKYVEIKIDDNQIVIHKEKLNEENHNFEVIDGQHRLEGIRDAFEAKKEIAAIFKELVDNSIDSNRQKQIIKRMNRFRPKLHAFNNIREIIEYKNKYEKILINIEKMEIPVVAVFEASQWNKALIFTKVNGYQKPVSKSSIYDLFSLSPEKNNPIKIANDITKALNFNPGPLQYRIKMLGTKLGSKDSDEFNETISQGTFTDNLYNAITKKDSALKSFLDDKEDKKIHRFILNLFKSVEETWPNEWVDTKFILSKSVGIKAIFDSTKEIASFAEHKGNFKVETIKLVFKKTKENLRRESKELTSDNFPSSSKGATKLRGYIIAAAETLTTENNNKQ